jgi:excisionase family DNA binding protein
MLSERYLTVAEVAEMLHLARGTVYNLASRGQLPRVKIFGALRFPLSKIEELIEQFKSTSRVQKPK